MSIEKTAPYPHSQHWTTRCFRVTVMHYKSQPGQCVICGTSPARHSAWADGRGERTGFGAGPAWFCDAHRPEKGTLPPLDYVRLLSGVPSGVITYERTQPWPGRRCSRCGQPPVLWYQHICRDCDAPEAFYATTRLRPGGAASEPERHHLHHAVAEDYRCAAHQLELPVTA